VLKFKSECCFIDFAFDCQFKLSKNLDDGASWQMQRDVIRKRMQKQNVASG